ncbi:hypothetical protein [Fusobacterium pseudoperiodonticum]|uniref:hypothetical protein n=1 Tax=Fusobacterium pseudoperiodonticum TaxID=2663009 RepID=UPI0028EFAFBC|nr:hypothetical protein [Fusobacterium pseudoperiodonticum]
MAKYTENIRLAQPEGSDYYDIEVFNHNSELIDKKIGEMDNSLATIKEGATREKAGIVQLGTEEGKALEGMMLARLAGAYGYGGDIQDEGVKNPNYIYYDRNTRKMYKCLKQNQDISANVTNFIPLDNNSLLERLENLIKYQTVNKTVGSRYSSLIFSKTGNIGHVFLDIPSNVTPSLIEGTLLFTFPAGFKPKTFNLKLIISHPSGRTARTRYDANTGNLYILNKLDVAESMYLDTFYFLD